MGIKDLIAGTANTVLYGNSKGDKRSSVMAGALSAMADASPIAAMLFGAQAKKMAIDAQQKDMLGKHMSDAGGSLFGSKNIKESQATYNKLEEMRKRDSINGTNELESSDLYKENKAQYDAISGREEKEDKQQTVNIDESESIKTLVSNTNSMVTSLASIEGKLNPQSKELADKEMPSQRGLVTAEGTPLLATTAEKPKATRPDYLSTLTQPVNPANKRGDGSNVIPFPIRSSNVANNTQTNVMSKVIMGANNVYEKPEFSTDASTTLDAGFRTDERTPTVTPVGAMSTIPDKPEASNDSGSGIGSFLGDMAGSLINKPAGVPKKAGDKSAGKVGGKAAEKAGGKGVAKAAGKGVLKSVIKKIPVLGAIAGLGFGAQRLFSGDLAGAGLEVASGLAGTLPGVGTATSVGIDAVLAAKDMAEAEGKQSELTEVLKKSEETVKQTTEVAATKATSGGGSTVINNITNNSSSSSGGGSNVVPTIRSTESSFEKVQMASHWGRRV